MEASIVRKSFRKQPDVPIAHAQAPLNRNIKLQQCAKIAELGQALLAAGLQSTESRARALGLCRSTTWTILKAGHKSTGLTASIIRRILDSPELPSGAKQVIEQYVALKLAGAYGHDKKQVQRFRAGLGPEDGSEITRSLRG